jgi:hypothetical protein
MNQEKGSEWNINATYYILAPHLVSYSCMREDIFFCKSDASICACVASTLPWRCFDNLPNPRVVSIIAAAVVVNGAVVGAFIQVGL